MCVGIDVAWDKCCGVDVAWDFHVDSQNYHKKTLMLVTSIFNPDKKNLDKH